MTVPVDMNALPATQHLVMSVLAAQHSAGRSTWQFRGKVGKTLRDLEVLGLVEVLPVAADKTLPARLTEAGVAVVEAVTGPPEAPAAADATEAPTEALSAGAAATEAPAVSIAPEQQGADVGLVRSVVQGYLDRLDPDAGPAGVRVERSVRVQDRGEYVELDVEVLHVVDGIPHPNMEWSTGLVRELTDLLQAEGLVLVPHAAARIVRRS